MEYKKKIEKQFGSNKSKAAWDGLKTITGYTAGKPNFHEGNVEKLVNDLNVFYARFDKEDSIGPSPDCVGELAKVELSADEVRNVFKQLNERKAAGPDGLSPKLLKTCYMELSDIFHLIFSESLATGTIPSLWKTATVIPVPQIAKPAVLNDYRPVALTPIVAKCLEKLVLSRLMPAVSPFMDPLQFAYQKNRSVEDAAITVLNYVYQHLEKSGTYARALFVDFSSAFNTILPRVLVDKLVKMEVSPYLCRWIANFLSERNQLVCIKSNGENVYSNMLTLNTGAPQGCVLSPALFTVYTTDCVSNNGNCKLVKYADDTVLIGLISDNDEHTYRAEIASMTQWCASHNLLLNVSKTKEVIFDFRKSPTVVNQVCIDDAGVKIVTSYKYLGTDIRGDLRWSENVARQVKKANKRMYFLRKLKQFDVNKTILRLFYASVIESVVIFAIIVWFRGASFSDKRYLNRVRKTAERIIGSHVESFENLYNTRVLKKAKAIMADTSHPLYNLYVPLPSGRRIRTVPCRTKRHADSFIPYSMILCNRSNTLACM